MVDRRWVRLVATGLLLLASADLGLPSVCRTDDAPLPATESQAQEIDQHGPKSSVPEPMPEDDCFCCCAHIRPQPITRGCETLVPLNERLGLSAPTEPEIRTSILFHPPRQ